MLRLREFSTVYKNRHYRGFPNKYKAENSVAFLKFRENMSQLGSTLLNANVSLCLSAFNITFELQNLETYCPLYESSQYHLSLPVCDSNHLPFLLHFFITFSFIRSCIHDILRKLHNDYILNLLYICMNNIQTALI